MDVGWQGLGGSSSVEAPEAWPEAWIIAGPTGSGKSALALHLARAVGGAVINADSMQVYRDLPILTACPTSADEAAAPHRLYRIRDAAEPGSAAWWRAEALDAMAQVQASGLRPILCGGTGLYLSALTQGIADIPEPSPEARAEARRLLDEEGAPALHARLAAADPLSAATLRPSDGQRVARAWEVWRSTGRPLRDWQATALPPAGWRFRMVLLDPARDALRRAIATRFDGMMAAGALEEAAALHARRLDPGLPAMRAHGVVELGAFLRGEATLAGASARTVDVTMQYTKRQRTWFRHRTIVQPGLLHTIHARYAGRTQLSETEQVDLARFLNMGA